MAKLGMGMMRLPLLDENDVTNIDYEQVNEMVDAFMDAGFNQFDTAYVYHEGIGEQAFKKAVVDRYPRDSFKISTNKSFSSFFTFKTLAICFAVIITYELSKKKEVNASFFFK